MKRFFGLILGVAYGFCLQVCYATDFDVLPDLPEALSNAAQASSVTTANTTATALATQSVGHEPNFVSMIFSLLFVIILVYATGILYTKLNKFGAKALKNQRGELDSSHVSVISTTPLGANKTLHVVELDGRRLLIGASSASIDLIKDLGKYPPCEVHEGEYSKIEIPNIRIPKIEIPKIEIPGFTRVISRSKVDDKDKVDEVKDLKSAENNNISEENDDSFEFSEIYEENSDGIIDKLFQTQTEESSNDIEEEHSEHKVDPDDFALYKKYL